MQSPSQDAITSFAGSVTCLSSSDIPTSPITLCYPHHKMPSQALQYLSPAFHPPTYPHEPTMPSTSQDAITSSQHLLPGSILPTYPHGPIKSCNAPKHPKTSYVPHIFPFITCHHKLCSICYVLPSSYISAWPRHYCVCAAITIPAASPTHPHHNMPSPNPVQLHSMIYHLYTHIPQHNIKRDEKMPCARHQLDWEKNPTSNLIQ